MNARVSKLIFSTLEPKSEAITSLVNLYEKQFNQNMENQNGLWQAKGSKTLKNFLKQEETNSLTLPRQDNGLMVFPWL